MSNKYHINKHGVPAVCRAQQGNCPLGGSDSHFDNQSEAQSFIDKKNAEKYGVLNKVQSNPRHDKDRFDRIERLVDNVGAEKVGRELSRMVDSDRLKELNEGIIYDYDLEPYVDRDGEEYEKYDDISKSIGSETALQELSHSIAEDKLQSNIDFIEDTFDLKEA